MSRQAAFSLATMLLLLGFLRIAERSALLLIFAGVVPEYAAISILVASGAVAVGVWIEVRKWLVGWIGGVR